MSYEPSTPPPPSSPTPPPGPPPTVPGPMPPQFAPVQQPIPVRQIGISAGTAFKAGFFGFFGVFVASLIVSAVVVCFATVVGTAIIESISSDF